MNAVISPAHRVAPPVLSGHGLPRHGSDSPQIVCVIITSAELDALAGGLDSADLLRRLLSGHALDLSTAPAAVPPVASVATYPQQPATVAKEFGFSDRESTIARMLCSHMTLGEIARNLYISVNTAKSHTRSIYRKLDVSSRSEAAAILNHRQNSKWALHAALAS